MNCRAVAIVCFWYLTLAASFGLCQGRVVVVEEQVFTAQTLSGHVQMGVDERGVSGVLVEICDAKWKKAYVSTTTDENGVFSFPSKKKGLYYLRLSRHGANPLLVKVRVTSKGPASVSLAMQYGT